MKKGNLINQPAKNTKAVIQSSEPSSSLELSVKGIGLKIKSDSQGIMFVTKIIGVVTIIAILVRFLERVLINN